MKLVKRMLFNIRYRLWTDIKRGNGRVGAFYFALSKWVHPRKPFYWRRNTHPLVDLPSDYVDFIPLAHWTGEGWFLHWGAVDEDGFSESLDDALFVQGQRNLEYHIEEWPYYLPVASTSDLERVGFEII